jgi:hypothetical protein
MVKPWRVHGSALGFVLSLKTVMPLSSMTAFTSYAKKHHQIDFSGAYRWSASESFRVREFSIGEVGNLDQRWRTAGSVSVN